MSRPSVLARSVADARRILEAAGVPVLCIEQTAPPGGAPTGPPRVVRERSTPEGVCLVTAASIPRPEGTDSHD